MTKEKFVRRQLSEEEKKHLWEKIDKANEGRSVEFEKLLGISKKGHEDGIQTTNIDFSQLEIEVSDGRNDDVYV